MSNLSIRCRQSIIFAFLMVCTSSLWPYSPYTTRELDELEKEFVQQINHSSSVIKNPLAVEYINHLGKRLAQYAEISPAPRFFIVNSNEINAFAGPGGYIGIHSKLILATSNEHELAAVMAHEIAHVRLHHLYRFIEHQKQMRIPMLASLLASIALGVINPTLASGAMMASLTGFAQDNINFTRANEKEADRIGIDMLKKAGFNPKGMITFFYKMQQNSRYYYTANIPQILRTHPLDEDRIAEAENRCMNLQHQKFTEGRDYYFFKEIIRNHMTSEPSYLTNYYTKTCGNHPSCQYGLVLTLLNTHHYHEAQLKLAPLISMDKTNLFYLLALGQSQVYLNDPKGIRLLQELYNNYPNNYALIHAYSEALMQTNQPLKASFVLLKGTRQFKEDLALCHQLAFAQAQANQSAYAYLTEAKCQTLEGNYKDALHKLKLVKSQAKHDAYLFARASAMISDIKFLLKK
ncbi:MAG: Zn-dependent protease [Legionellaceae bacterium]|nr:Zn-dependent protease [Legionellaceae bacterium]HCA89543.1 Zn-dependent protease [Legionellales bacterium]|tara:strand:+ start:1336 stop:2724 length:1389 start_codon:yes stop_codon:yes gene_type:complete